MKYIVPSLNSEVIHACRVPFRGCTECDIGSMSDLISMLGCCVSAVPDY